MIKKQLVSEKPSNIGKSRDDYLNDNGNFILNLKSTETDNDTDNFYSGIFNTQNIDLDWSRFENHTFFNSAKAKVDVAFDKIINEYPFDGNENSILQYIKSLTGFEKWVFDQFPRSTGSIHFKNDPINNDGIFIEIFEPGGIVYDDLNNNDNIVKKLNFSTDSFSIQLNLFVPEVQNSNQVIFQKQEVINGYSKGFSAFLSESNSVNKAKIKFFVGSGSVQSELEYEIKKGIFNNYTFICNRTDDLIYLFENDILVSKSSKINAFKDLFVNTNFLIASGSDWIINSASYIQSNNLLSASIDEFRIFNKILTHDNIKNSYNKTIYSQDNLLVYYKFNEPSSKISNDSKRNSIVLDYSGNSYHTYIQNSGNQNYFTLNSGSIRQFQHESAIVENELYYYNPILFTTHPDIINLNQTLHLSSSLYDEYNPNLITKLVPKHYLSQDIFIPVEDGKFEINNSQIILSFLYSYAKFFDELKIILDSFSRLRTINYDSKLSVQDNFIKNLFDYFGFEQPNLFNKKSELPTDSPLEDFLKIKKFNNVKNQILKRILVSIPEIIKSKGTYKSLEIFLRSVGIEPNINFSIKEYNDLYIKNIKFLRKIKKSTLPTLKVTNNQYLKSKALKGSYLNYTPTLPETSTQFYTANSWSFESIYRLNSTYKEQSLVKFFANSGSNKHLIYNVVCDENSVKFYIDADPNDLKSAVIVCDNINLFDGNLFNLCIGKDKENKKYFLSIKKQQNGEIIENRYEEIIFTEVDLNTQIPISYKEVISYSDDGITFEIGNSTNITTNTFLNKTSNTQEKITLFDGYVSQLRFWTKKLSNDELFEHAINYENIGVDNALQTITFDQDDIQGEVNLSKYERLLINVTFNQPEKEPISNQIELFDYTKNNFHITGYNYSENEFKNEIIVNSTLSNNIDSFNINDKIRIRSFTDVNNLNYYSRISPIYELQNNDIYDENPKLSIEYSLINYLNSDISNIFSTMDLLQKIIGSPENLYSYEYKNLESLRRIYFSKLNDKINFKSFYEIFKWFDSTLENFIKEILPRKMIFYGVNYVIEQHNLERSKYEHKNIGQYTGTNDYSNSLDRQIGPGSI